MRAGVLIPVKAFSAAKLRLSEVLDAEHRDALSRWMAERVVASADSLPVFVVCDDEEVRSWATSVGATALWTPRLGLNAAVGSGVAQLATQGFDRVVIAHSDLPLATTLKHFADHDGITLVADTRRDGTNVLALSTALAFEFHYGAGSFQAHLHEAHLLGAELHVEHDDALALDVDTPADLADPRIQEIVPPWAQTNQANPS